MTTLTFHTDPAHGWLEVPLDTLINKLTTEQGLSISIFSYFSDQNKLVYLEEDCDASIFLSAIDAPKFHYDKPGFHYKHTDNDSFIRNLPSFQSSRFF